MIANFSLLAKLVLVSLIITAGIVGMATAASNLTINKTADEAEYESGDLINWTVTVKNNNETQDVSSVNVSEIFDGRCSEVSNQTDYGKYEDGWWNFTSLEHSAEATLKLNVTCQVACGKVEIVNTVNITVPEDDEDPDDNNATAKVNLTGRECNNVTVKPETLNIKKVNVQGNGKGGVITVFITVGDVFNKTDIIMEDSSITCNDAESEKILFSEKDNGTIIAKFRRGDLNITATDGMTEISCYGEINTTAGKFIVVGSDEVRVIHADDGNQQSSLLDRILKFLGIKTSEGEDETVADVELPDSLEGIKNLGQFNKLIRETPTVTLSGEEEDNEVSPGPTEKGKGRYKGLEIEPTPTPDEENGKGRGQGKPADENGGKGKD